MKSCGIYCLKKEYIVVPYSRTRDWIWVAHQPVFRIEKEDRRASIIGAVWQALELSTLDIPNRSIAELSLQGKQLLKVMGQQSFPKLDRISRYCQIRKSEHGVMTVTPYVPYAPGSYARGMVPSQNCELVLDIYKLSSLDLEKSIVELFQDEIPWQ